MLLSSDVLVEIKKISKIYKLDKTEVRAVDELTYTIRKGDFIVLGGPSGSGKTTLLNIIGCIDKPTEGRVIFAGNDITDIPIEALYHLRLRNVGFIFQSFNLIPVLTAFENVELPLLFKNIDGATMRKKVEDSLIRVGLGDKLNQKPANLSGGQRQRVAIARALAGDPSLIIADEPTASLDRKNAGLIIELLKELNEESGVTIVLASHDPDIIKYAKTKLIMTDGKITSKNPETI
jgi:putative ABC transport system ATP-binding protein